MRPRLAQREVALAGVALLAGAISLAVTSWVRDDKSGLPEPSGSYTALAGSSGPGAFGRRTVCGETIKADTEGVAHPVLPCGARIYISYGGRKVLTQVIDRGPNAPGREFDVTKALADEIGLHGTRSIRWSFAR